MVVPWRTPVCPLRQTVCRVLRCSGADDVRLHHPVSLIMWLGIALGVDGGPGDGVAAGVGRVVSCWCVSSPGGVIVLVVRSLLRGRRVQLTVNREGST